MFDDTSLMRMIIEDLTEDFNWTFEEAFDKFYNSAVCKHISNRATGYFTCAPWELIEVFKEEIDVKG